MGDFLEKPPIGTIEEFYDQLSQSRTAWFSPRLSPDMPDYATLHKFIGLFVCAAVIAALEEK